MLSLSWRILKDLKGHVRLFTRESGPCTCILQKEKKHNGNAQVSSRQCTSDLNNCKFYALEKGIQNQKQNIPSMPPGLQWLSWNIFCPSVEQCQTVPLCCHCRQPGATPLVLYHHFHLHCQQILMGSGMHC